MSTRTVCDRCGAMIGADPKQDSYDTAESILPTAPAYGHFTARYLDAGPRNVAREADLCGACCAAHLAFLRGEAVAAKG